MAKKIKEETEEITNKKVKKNAEIKEKPIKTKEKVAKIELPVTEKKEEKSKIKKEKKEIIKKEKNAEVKEKQTKTKEKVAKIELPVTEKKEKKNAEVKEKQTKTKEKVAKIELPVTEKKEEKIAERKEKQNEKEEIYLNQVKQIKAESIIENKIETTQVQVPQQDQDALKPMSKSAKRRAKKKAKKIAQEQQNKIQNIDANVLQKKSNDTRQSLNNKKNHNQNKNNEQRLEPLAMLEKRTEKQQEQENTDEIYSQNFGTNYKKQQKPIPWVDLSKLLEEEKSPTNNPTNESNEITNINSDMLLTLQQRRDAFYQNFYRDVEKFVITEMLVEKGSNVVVAVSGGVDSVVLLDVFANLADTYKFQISVAHYNHNLRGEASLKDEQFVHELSAKYNVPYYSSGGKVEQYAEKNGMSIEEAARYLRYVFFERTTRTIKSDFLVTAHTSDDSAETFLLNLFRGAGLTGLSGIPAKRQFVKDVILIRPFLKLPKQTIIEYANKRGLEWHEDESNLQDKYTRNKIRLDLIPKLKKDYSQSIIDIINRSAKLIQGADRIIHSYVRTHLTQILFDISNDSVSIKLPLFKTFDEFIRGEMLQTILMKYFRTTPPNMKIIDRILKLETSEVGTICDISKTIFAVKDRQAIVISKKNSPNMVNQKIQKSGKFQIGDLTFILNEITPEEVEYSKNNKIEFFDYDLISQELTLRNWEHSDDFNPLGMDGSMKISDFLMNIKVPFLDKPNVLVLTNEKEDIIWVCRHRISDKYKITTKTKKVLRIEIKEKGKS